MIVAHLVQTASRLPTDTSALKSAISALKSSIPALESEIARLESSSIPWEHWAWFFTALVLLGVLLELWVIRHDWRDEMKEWAIWYFIGIIQSPDRPPIIKTLVEVASVLLIGIGIAGELGAGIKIAVINGALRSKSAELRSRGDELRTKSDQLLGLVTQQAGTAGNNALLAQQSAKAAGVDASKAKTKTETVSQVADDTEKKLQLALSMLSGRSVRDPEKMKAELQQSAWPPLTFRSYKGDIEGWNACLNLCLTVGSIKSIKVTFACGSEALVPSDALEGVQMSGFGQGWADIMNVERLRVILRDDGGFGDDLSDLGSTFLTADTTKIDILIGIHPRLSLGRLEALQKAQKNKTTNTSNPRRR